MNRIKKFFENWGKLEITWLVFVLVLQTVVWIINGDTIFMLVMTLCNSLSLVLGAKGTLIGVLLNIAGTAMYAINALGIPLYGEVMGSFLFSIPVSIATLILWKKNSTKSGEVKFRNMTPKLLLMIIIATLGATIIYSIILKQMGGAFAFMDSLTTVVSVIAGLLFMLRYSEQWLMWVIVNALSIAMWVMVLISGDSSALLMVVMKSVNLCNALYGYLNWRKLAKKVLLEQE